MNENNQEGTVVGANVKLQGVIADDNDIIVHGMVEGEIISEKNIQITPSASVVGPVKGQVVTLAGSVEGDVVGLEKTEVLPTGKINGSITTKELIIQSGAIFNGKCQMTETPETKKPEPKPEKSAPKEKNKKKDLPAEKEEKQPTEKNELDPQDLDDFELE